MTKVAKKVCKLSLFSQLSAPIKSGVTIRGFNFNADKCTRRLRGPAYLLYHGTPVVRAMLWVSLWTETVVLPGTWDHNPHVRSNFAAFSLRLFFEEVRIRILILYSGNLVHKSHSVRRRDGARHSPTSLRRGRDITGIHGVALSMIYGRTHTAVHNTRHVDHVIKSSRSPRRSNVSFLINRCFL